jgi:hypothetical protein
MSVLDHLKMIKQSLEFEKYSLIPSHEKTADAMHEVLISKNVQPFIRSPSGLISILDGGNIEGASCFYDMFKLVPHGHDDLKRAIADYIMSTGSDIAKEIGGAAGFDY